MSIENLNNTLEKETKKANKKKALVIGAGLGRTGTTSLKRALEILGYDPCFHMEEMVHGNYFSFWKRLESGKDYSWSEIFDKYGATCDNPFCLYWEEILKEYPDSKVILTTRNPESWVKSLKDTLLPIHTNISFSIKVVMFLVPKINNFFNLNYKMISKMTNNDFSDKNLIKVFNEHIKSVEQKCPKDKLLKFEVKQGWKPLCEFLGKEIPKQDFPNINDTNEIKTRFGRLEKAGIAIFSVFILLLAVGIYYLLNRFYFK